MRLITIAILLTAAALLPGAAVAQQEQSTTEARLAALEAAQKAILKELQEIKALLQARQPAPAAAAAPAPPSGVPAFDLTITGSASKGRADAPLVIVEFSDFECPFCGRYARDTFANVEREYVDTGKVRYVFRHFPIAASHPRAMGSAQAAECALAQGKFWELHSAMFANQRALQPEALVAAAQKLGLKTDAFQYCMAAPASPKIKRDFDEGSRASISGTPTFFIGTLTKDGKVKVLRRMVGAQSFAAFQKVLDSLLPAPR